MEYPAKTILFRKIKEINADARRLFMNKDEKK